jgi:PAS domain S-box-containing protein
MTRFLSLLCSFLAGALVLCLFCSLQTFFFDWPYTPGMHIIPFFLGGVCGLAIGERTARIRQLNDSLRRANVTLDRSFQESEERYQLLFHHNKAVQLLVDPETGDIVENNEAAQQFYGFDGDALNSMSIMDLNIAEPEITRRDLQRALNREQLCFQFQHRLSSGEIRPVAVYTVPVPHRGRTLLHSVIIDVAGQNLAESHLRRKTLEQRLLLDSIPVGVWYLKTPETYGSVNQAFADFFDRSPLEMAHQPLEAMLNPDMLSLALASNRQVFADKKPLHYEQWLTLGKSEPRYMTITKTPKCDANGEVEFVVCTATDTTGMHQARELLRIERDLHVALTAAHSQQETLHICLAKAIEASHTDCGGLYLVNRADGSLDLAVHQGLSDNFVRFAAHYEADTPHARLTRRKQPIYSCYEEVARRVGNGRLRGEGLRGLAVVPIATQDRVIACLNVASRQTDHISPYSRIALERIVAHLGIFLAQKEQETLTRQHEQNLNALFNTIKDLVFILDLNGRIVHLNAAVVHRLGYRPEELIGRSVLAVHPADRQEEAGAIVAAFLAGKCSVCPLPLASKTGETIPVETHLTLGEWSGQQVIFGLSRDIGYRLQLERQERLLLKNEGLERMAGAMAHHFNNLLTIVAGNLELARDDATPPSEVSGLLTNALEGSKRAIAIGQALLIYTGQFAEAAGPLNLAQWCGACLTAKPASLPTHITLETDFPLPGPLVTANADQLEQALTALITNAAETIGKECGRITVRVAVIAADAIASPHIFPAGWTPGHKRYGSLEVSDTGGGIDEKQMANIFDPFYSEKFVGRGLGLPLALSIVKKLDGAIAVTSRPRQGSTFQVLLPEIAQPLENNA